MTGVLNPLSCNCQVLVLDVCACDSTPMHDRGNSRCSRAKKGVYDQVARACQRKDEPFWKLHRKLARVFGFLDVIRLDVGKYPNVAGVFPVRVARVFPYSRSFISTLPWILLRDANRIEVEYKLVTFCVPKNGLVSSGKTALAI